MLEKTYNNSRPVNLPSVLLTFVQKSFYDLGTKLYELPLYIRRTESKTAFKNFLVL